MQDLVLAIDQGTTNTKAILFDRSGQTVAKASQPVEISHPQPGWVEQDARQIWHSVQAAVQECVAGKETSIAAVGISNQRESVVAWDAKTGEPAGPCVSWQCRRGETICAKLLDQGHAAAIQARTGLPLDPMFSAGKAHWLTANASCNREDLRLGTMDSWLLWQLTGGKRHACDESNASRTQLFDIDAGSWDEQLCTMFAVPIKALPETLPTDARFGTVAAGLAVPAGLPIRALIGDSHAALFGHGITAPGTVKATYGTGSSLMSLLPDNQDSPGTDTGLAKTLAWHVGGQRVAALEGNILVCAASLPWAAELLGLDGGPKQLAELAATVDTTLGVHFVPALVGLGAPYWDAQARGMFDGLTFNTTPAHLARAVLEAVAWQVSDVYAAMAAVSPAPLEALWADGGPSSNDWLMALQADFLGCPVLQCSVPEVSALGAAGIAGIGVGIWANSAEFACLPRPQHKIEPGIDVSSRKLLQDGWHAAVSRARHPN